MSQSASGVQVRVTINALGVSGEYRTRTCEIPPTPPACQ
jgi:hypothetical protein